MTKLAAALFFVLLAFAVAGAIDLAEQERLSVSGFVAEKECSCQQ